MIYSEFPLVKIFVAYGRTDGRGSEVLKEVLAPGP